MTTYINADDGIVSGVAGLKYGSDASGALVLQTNGTTAITISAAQAVTFTGAVSFATASFTNLSYTGTLTGGTGVVNLGSGQFYKDASGNVGIGTTSLSAEFTVNNETDTTAYNGTATDGQLTAGATQLIRAAAGANTNVAQLVFQTRAAQPFNRIVSSGGTAPFMAFATNNAERMRIDSAGNVGIGTSVVAYALDIRTPAANIYVAPSTATNNALTRYANTGGIGYVGLDSSVGGLTSAYALNLFHSGAYPIVMSTSGTERMRIDSSGKLLVGATTTIGYGNKVESTGGFSSLGSPQFNITSTSSSTDFEWVLRSGARQLFYVTNATIVANLSATGVWTNASDARYKENIVDSKYGLDAVMALKPRSYNLIDQEDKPQVGFIAQEVLDVIPEVVESVVNNITKEERYTLSYGNMVAVLTKAIQQQQALITDLTTRLTILENK